MKKNKILLFIYTIALSTFCNLTSLDRRITQLNVPSYYDVTDQYKKLVTRMFAGKPTILRQTFTDQQLRSWNAFLDFFKLYIGQDLTVRYLAKNKPLSKALNLPYIIQKKEKLSPEWIREEILDPLQETLRILQQEGVTKKSARAAVLLIGRDILKYWLQIYSNLTPT